MKIRKATKKDLKLMLKIVEINNPTYPGRVLKEFEEMFSKSLLKPTYILLEDKKEILAFGGFIPSWVDNNVYNLFWINVNPKYQNKGIGTRIVKELLKEIKKIKNPKPKMVTISTKIPLFYQKLGFKKMTLKYDKDYILMGKLL